MFMVIKLTECEMSIYIYIYIFKLIIPLRHASLARQHQGHDWTYNMNGSELSILKHSDLKNINIVYCECTFEGKVYIIIQFRAKHNGC